LFLIAGEGYISSCYGTVRKLTKPEKPDIAFLVSRFLFNCTHPLYARRSRV
jgi:hypothetical protein